MAHEHLMDIFCQAFGIVWDTPELQLVFGVAKRRSTLHGFLVEEEGDKTLILNYQKTPSQRSESSSLNVRHIGANEPSKLLLYGMRSLNNTPVEETLPYLGIAAFTWLELGEKLRDRLQDPVLVQFDWAASLFLQVGNVQSTPYVYRYLSRDKLTA